MAQRLKLPYQPLHRSSTLMLDERGFVYLFGVKICRYRINENVLEFQAGSGREKSYVYVEPGEFAEGIRRVTESKRGESS
jgi:hypothetical protein